MVRRLIWPVPAALALLALGAGHAQARAREAATVGAAIEVVEQANAIPERGIPAGLLRDAAGVAVIPNIVKAGFIVGARHGRGVVLVRTRDGGWSNPVFVSLTGGSIGWQAGAQSTDLVLVFKTGRSVERILQNRGKLTLGADVGVAVGPVGRQAAAATDAQLKAEIYSYSRSRGLFAGLSLEGASLSLDWRDTSAYYGVLISPAEILGGAAVPVPRAAALLKGWLDYYTQAQTQP